MQHLTLKQSRFRRYSRYLRPFIAVCAVTVLAVSSLSVYLPGPADAANAADFNPGRIIDDDVFTRTSMTTSQIQSFLDDQGSDCVSNCLKDYTQDGESAATIIRKAALDYKINPQTLIVLLQKEQGLVTSTAPTSYMYKYATGYCVTDSGLCGNWWGFRLQVRKAAQLFRNIINSPNSSNYPPGTRQILYHPNTACGKKSVTIYNAATSALYHYTPYTPNSAALNNLYGTGNSCSTYGNRNFWRYFTDWFGSTRGSFRLIECSGNKYMVEAYIPVKRQITDDGVEAWGLENSYFKPDDSGCSYPTYSEILGRHIRSRNTKKVYIVDTGRAFWVQSQSIADAWDVGNISNGTFPQFNGSTIQSLAIERQTPRLARSSNPASNRVYLLNNGQIHHIEGTSSSSSNSDSLRLIRGYDEEPMEVFSSNYLSDLKNTNGEGATIDYGFRVGSQRYVFDHGMVRKIHPSYYSDRWANISSLTAPELDPDVPNVFHNGITLTKGFQRSGVYFWIGLDGGVYNTSSTGAAEVYGIDDSPVITSLLLGKLAQ